MLKFKHNTLFSIFSGENIDIAGCISSCLVQEGVNPYLFVCHSERGNSYYTSKSLCENPTIYEPELVVSKNMMITFKTEEGNDVRRAINFGLENKCKYFCFIYVPSILDKQFCDRSIKELKDEVIGTYSNLMDSGKPIYTNICNGNINAGPVFMITEKWAKTFNFPLMGDFLRHLTYNGAFYHFDEFLIRNQWTKILSKN